MVLLQISNLKMGVRFISARSNKRTYMILDRNDALYAANVFVDYFSNFGRIDDYLRKVKLERMSNYPVSGKDFQPRG